MVRAWLSLLIALLFAGCSQSGTPTGTPELTDAERIAIARQRQEKLGGCRFVQGFSETRALAPEVIGECIENERTDPTSGDSTQRTTRGLLVWRKADGLIAFTDGHRTWVRGPDGGLRSRLNTERFTWESVPQDAVAIGIRVVTPGPPLAVPTAAPASPGSTPLGLTPIATSVGSPKPASGTPSPAAATPTAPAPPAKPAPGVPTKSSEPPKPLPAPKP